MISYAWEGTRHDGAADQPLILNAGLAWFFTILWIAGATVTFFVYLFVLR